MLTQPKRVCDRCGTVINNGDEWYHIEQRDNVDLNKPSIITSDICHNCGMELFTCNNVSWG